MKRTMVITTLREAGVVPEVRRVIVSMHDDITALKQHVRELGMLLDKLTDLLNIHGQVLTKAKPLLSAVEQKAKEWNVRVDNDPVVQGEE